MGIGASPMPVITPGGRAFRTLARDLAAIAWRRAEGGDVDGAIEVVAALGRLADLAELPPLLVRTLIGAAVRQTAFDVTEELVTRDGLDAGQLARLAGHLDDLAGTSLAAGLAGERVLLESVLLGAYDDGGRLLPAELTARLVPGTPPPTGLARLANLPGLFAPRRPAVEAQLEAAFALPSPDGAAEASATSDPAPGRAAAAAAAAGRAADVLRGNLPPILIDLVAPSLEAVGRAATEWEAAFRVARLAVAVRRHERRTGELPDDLDELELPAVAGGGGGASAASGDLRLDPRTGDAFVYERTPEAPGFRIRPAGAERPTAPDPLAQP
jgi:hypothetical protein